MISLLPRPRARRQGPSASMCLQVQARTCQRVAFPSLTRGCGFGAARRSGEGHGPGQCHWHLLKFTSTGISPGPSTTNLNPLPASDSSRGPDPARGPGRGGGPSSGAGVPVPSGSPPGHVPHRAQPHVTDTLAHRVAQRITCHTMWFLVFDFGWGASNTRARTVGTPCTKVAAARALLSQGATLPQVFLLVRLSLFFLRSERRHAYRSGRATVTCPGGRAPGVLVARCTFGQSSSGLGCVSTGLGVGGA
eukprot:758524-Rhodomonas_salina.2